MQTCTVVNSKSYAGRGGVISIPNSATSSNLIFQTTTFTNSEAKFDGGLFYVGGTGDKILTMTESKMLTNKAK